MVWANENWGLIFHMDEPLSKFYLDFVRLRVEGGPEADNLLHDVQEIFMLQSCTPGFRRKFLSFNVLY